MRAFLYATHFTYVWVDSVCNVRYPPCMSDTSSISVSAKTLPHSLVEIRATIPHKALVSARKAALRHLNTETELKGFRKGHAPEAMLVEHFGEGAVEAHAFEEALRLALPELLIAHAPRAIASPLLKSQAKREDGVEVVLEVPVLPEIVLPDYRTIAKTVCEKEADPKTASVSDEEYGAELKEHLRAYARATRAALVGKDSETFEIKDEDIPILTDDIAKQLGPFADAVDLEKRLRESMQLRKELSLAEKRRLAILEALFEKTSIDLPEVLVTEELGGMFREFEASLTRAGVTLEAYLAHAKKTREEFAAEWHPQAEKRAALELILASIAEAEQVKPDTEVLERDVAHTLEHLTDADPERVRAFIAHRLVREATLSLLEGGK